MKDFIVVTFNLLGNIFNGVWALFLKKRDSESYNKNKSRKIFFIIVLFLLLVAIGGYIIYYWLNNTPPTDK